MTIRLEKESDSLKNQLLEIETLALWFAYGLPLAKSDMWKFSGCLSEIANLVRVAQMQPRIKVSSAEGAARPAPKTDQALAFRDSSENPPTPSTLNPKPLNP